jgi:hypothetical protein
MPDKPAKVDPKESRKFKVGGKNFDEWAKDLRNSDPAIVENAIRTVVLYGDLAKGEALEIIVAKLNPRKYNNLDTSIKVNVLIAIGIIGVDSTTSDDAVDALIRALTDEQAIVRFHAALTLGAIGHDGAKATDKLLLKMKDPSTWEVRKACARALASVATPFKETKFPESRVIEGLRHRAFWDPCFQVRLEALQSLIVLGPPGGTPTEQGRFIDSLKTIAKREYFNRDRKEKEDKTVRLWADVAVMRMERAVVKEKEKFQKGHAKRLDDIGNRLTDPILGVKCQAARAIGQMGPYAKSQVERLADILGEEKDPIMIGWTVWALANIGKAAKPAIPALEKLYKSSKDEGFKLTVEDAIKHIRSTGAVIPTKKETKPAKEKVKVGRKARGDR